MQRTRWCATLCALATSVMWGTPAIGGESAYPDKPIRLIIPQATGGGSDTIGRYMTQRLSESLGQQFVVDNRPGAAGMLGAELVKQAPPDGYTLLLCAIDTITAPIVAQRASLDALRDFTPVTQLTQSPNVWLVNLAFRARTMKELIDIAKARPREVDYASSGIGSMQHLGGALLARMAGVELNHVPYKGGPPGLVDVMGGRIPAVLSGMQGALPHIKAGKIRALSVTTPKRAAVLPDVPTTAEALGLKDYEATNWQGLLFPAGTPNAIAARIASESIKILATPEARARLETLGYAPSGMTPEVFAGVMRTEFKRWSVLIKEAGIKAE